MNIELYPQPTTKLLSPFPSSDLASLCARANFLNFPLRANSSIHQSYPRSGTAPIMAPLILHNVPDDECYIGDDGIKRPYAMYFNQYVQNRIQ